ncbi:hypothetical protein GCM10007276_28250 [Agaricicola taiwanensis]|uniref:Sodium/calcium exchanger membrane region domain-containing protein n=1 Tax=Agaricicola taiwanensis TaxID=591372 RepID=A0A8J2YJY1_9RHOB|nr:sodium:calcium antiporter [Agaricicola taiwanensis]GGE49446.1 hypothetical protein GCM10007276_28250 [Agaricicola taiwanensis]
MDFAQFSPVINAIIFVAAGVVVWLAGARITTYANALSIKTGFGEAIVGMLLLAGITSLPEVGVTITSAATGAVDMAVNSMFGSIAFQIVILAVVDLLIGRRALTAVVPDPMVMLQGGLNVLLLALVVAGMIVGDVSIAGVGAWVWASLGAYVASVYIMAQSQGRRPWLAASHGKVDRRLDEQRKKAQAAAGDEHGDESLTRIIVWIAGLAAVVLGAGYLLAMTGDALAEQSGLGGSFMGFLLLAAASSLPELSTAITAAQKGLYTLAISDILGTNLINIALLFPIDAISDGEPVLNASGRFAQFGALLGIMVTALFVVGLAERGDKTVARMGLDSIAVFAVYGIGLIILYVLR